MKKKNRKQSKRRSPRRDPGSRLLDEIGRWLKANGGAGPVAGPIRLVEWPEDRARNLSAIPGLQFFSVDVKVMGRRPIRPIIPGPLTPPPNGVRHLGTVKKSKAIKKSA